MLVSDTQTSDVRNRLEQLIQEVRAGEPSHAARQIRELDLSGVTLIGLDLSKLELQGVDLQNANLFKVNLEGANLSEANLSGAELTGANFRGANLDRVTAVGVGLGNACLVGASFFSANLSGAVLSKADLTKANLSCANLHGARLREANLCETDFTEAILNSADLSLSCTDCATFHNAELRNARLRQIADYHKATWTGVDIRDINFAGAMSLRRLIIDQNYLKELRNRDNFTKAVYYLWWISCDCGRSVTRWSMWGALICIVYSYLYTLVAVDYGMYETWLSPMYFSLVTMTTLGYGDAVPSSIWAQITTMSQVVTGYVMFGVLLALSYDKLARRGE